MKSFRTYAHQMVDWMADYLENKEAYRVTPDVKPGDIYKQLPGNAPEKAGDMEDIIRDFEHIILPGITHWQHPAFFGYFPANNSEPSILAEMLTATLGVQGMSWLTSPAATELEERVTDWLRDAKGIDPSWKGVIQDTASTATLSALITAREKASDFRINEQGFHNSPKYRVYASEHVHSSIAKAVRIAGIGSENLVPVKTDSAYALMPEALEAAIRADKAAGYEPLCVVSTLGTTSSTAIDPLEAVTAIARRYGLWHHIDAAYAGTALLLPEYRWMIKGHERADSYVFNPHKWMFTNFDCSVLLLRNPEDLVRTFTMTPEYLKTSADQKVHNYRDWGIPLGRRFRALKLWMVIRSYGLEGIREKLKYHIQLAQQVKARIEAHPNLEILAPVPLNALCFRYVASGLTEPQLDDLNEKWMSAINGTGKAFFTHTRLDGKFVIRWVIGQTDVQQRHIESTWKLMLARLEPLLPSS